MLTTEQDRASKKLAEQGFCMLPDLVPRSVISEMLTQFETAFIQEEKSSWASKSRGQIYAARNLLQHIDLVREFWQQGFLKSFLRNELGHGFGLVRVLYFDKPPDRTWSLMWHKDTAIAVDSNRGASKYFSRPTVKAGVPHVVAADEILRQMLTLRIHLDEVTDENGPLKVIPGSHESSDSEGEGLVNAETILAVKGEVMAMRPLLTHGSGASIEGNKRHRRILHLEFSATEELPDGYQWHDFVSISS